MEFSRLVYWSGLLFPPPGDLPDPGIEPGPPALQADSLPAEPPGKPSPLVNELFAHKNDRMLTIYFKKSQSGERDAERYRWSKTEQELIALEAGWTHGSSLSYFPCFGIQLETVQNRMLKNKCQKNKIVGGSFSQYCHLVQWVVVLFFFFKGSHTSSGVSQVLVSWKTGMFSKVSKL